MYVSKHNGCYQAEIVKCGGKWRCIETNDGICGPRPSEQQVNHRLLVSETLCSKKHCMKSPTIDVWSTIPDLRELEKRKTFLRRYGAQQKNDKVCWLQMICHMRHMSVAAGTIANMLFI